MPYNLYTKPYQTPADLVFYMRAKGLTVNDELKAINFLESVNYYRFKIYLWPFLDQSLDSYHQGASFEKGVELYRFDEGLRNLLFLCISRIEIKLRSKLDQVVSSHTKNPFWYLDDSLIMRQKLFSMKGLRSRLASSFQDSKDEFSVHFKENYVNDTNSSFKQLPPFWVITELATFGNIQTIYQSLDKSQFQGPQNTNKLNTLAHEFGARNFAELNNWIKAIRDVRNRCAHHSRGWNANCRQPSSIVNMLSSQHMPQNTNKIYIICVLLKVIDDNLSLYLNLKDKLLQLYAKYPEAAVRAYSAGFPLDWEQDPVWS